MVKQENYITIQGWMVNSGLKGNELIAFALIYGFSQDEKSVFSGTAEYIGEWCGISRVSVNAILKKLTDEKCINKIKKGIYNDYQANPEYVKKLITICKETYQNQTRNLSDTCKETYHHIILDTDIDTDIDIKTSPEPSKEKNPEIARLSKLLFSLHKDNIDVKYNPSQKQIDGWYDEIERLNRLDGRSVQEIESVIRWVKTPGQFWAPNIMSGKKLREKFPTLTAQMNQRNTGQKKPRISSDAYTGGAW